MWAVYSRVGRLFSIPTLLCNVAFQPEMALVMHLVYNVLTLVTLKICKNCCFVEKTTYLDTLLENKGINKLGLSKNVNSTNNCSPNPKS